MKLKTHTYRGYTILPWAGPYGSHPDGEPRWFIQIQHHTGIDWSAEHCPKAFTLKQAREKIDQMCDYKV